MNFYVIPRYNKKILKNCENRFSVSIHKDSYDANVISQKKRKLSLSQIPI